MFVKHWVKNGYNSGVVFVVWIFGEEYSLRKRVFGWYGADSSFGLESLQILLQESIAVIQVFILSDALLGLLKQRVHLGLVVHQILLFQGHSLSHAVEVDFVVVLEKSMQFFHLHIEHQVWPLRTKLVHAYICLHLFTTKLLQQILNQLQLARWIVTLYSFTTIHLFQIYLYSNYIIFILFFILSSLFLSIYIINTLLSIIICLQMPVEIVF